jgi:putative hydrolase of the HAD superfamily
MATVLVFDLDDTLFPEEQFVLSGFRAVDSWLLERGHAGFLAGAELLFRNRIRGNTFDRTLSELKIARADLLVPELVKIYREHKPTLKLHEDAAWALHHFSKRKQLGLITDGYLITQQNKIAALQIAHLFKAMICSDEFGKEHWKPSPTPYQKLIESIGCRHQDCVYIADNPKKDFVTAKKLGWHTIQILRSGGEYASVEVPAEYEAEIKISSLHELAPIIQ